jgi:DNA polymerase elongation subunit (family B)
MNLALQNIYNFGRKIYLFLRNSDGSLSIKSDNTFHPYFFEPIDTLQTKYFAYDGTPVKKVPCSRPSDVPKMRSEDSYSSDIIYTKRYIIDKIDAFNKSPVKWAMIDIECLTDTIPNPEYNLISCITIYNSLSKEYKTWFLDDFKGSKKGRETKLLNFFIDYLKKEKFDILTGWNFTDFDFAYLYNRVKHRYHKNLAKIISPIKQCRYGNDEILYPAGTSIIDYMGFYRKIYNKEASYALDDIMEKELGKGKEYLEVDFSSINETIKLRNIDDVKGMVAIEEKLKLISYYDEIRRFSKCNWEDLPMKLIYSEGRQQKISNNSRIIDMLILEEAKRKNIILPNKKYENKRCEYKGARRSAEKKGRFFNICQMDVSGCYPQCIIDFCLDTHNIVEDTETYKEQYPLVEINGTYFKQNPNALLPTVTRKLLAEKNKLKNLKVKTKKTDSNYENIKTQYDAIKSICNSIYGVFALTSFRLYDIRVASAITYLGANVLITVVEGLKKKGYDVIYFDTDGLKVQGKEDLSEVCNELVKQWAKENFNKEISLKFEYEGYYEKLFIKALCHYRGYLNTGKEIEIKTKGIEAKRSNSTKFIKKFQSELMDKVMDGAEREEMIEWILQEINRFKTLPLEQIGFPCKLSRKLEDYNKNTPIFVRALKYTQEFIDFIKRIGELYYFIYVIPDKIDVDITTEIYVDDELIESREHEDIAKKDIIAIYLEKFGEEFDKKRVRVLHKKRKTVYDVLAFDSRHKNHINNIDWDIMIEKNILLKIKSIFDVMGWDYKELTLKNLN